MSPSDWSNYTCRMLHHFPHVITRNCHVNYMILRPIQSACHVALYGLYSHPFFACLGFRTKCDIFRIRIPFDEVNIWSKSGRRDRRNGTGFVRFRALSFLSLFKPCRALGSISRSLKGGVEEDEAPGVRGETFHFLSYAIIQLFIYCTSCKRADMFVCLTDSPWGRPVLSSCSSYSKQLCRVELRLPMDFSSSL
jgi:hypothetical protein